MGSMPWTSRAEIIDHALPPSASLNRCTLLPTEIIRSAPPPSRRDNNFSAAARPPVTCLIRELVPGLPIKRPSGRRSRSARESCCSAPGATVHPRRAYPPFVSFSPITLSRYGDAGPVASRSAMKIARGGVWRSGAVWCGVWSRSQCLRLPGELFNFIDQVWWPRDGDAHKRLGLDRHHLAAHVDHEVIDLLRATDA